VHFVPQPVFSVTGYCPVTELRGLYVTYRSRELAHGLRPRANLDRLNLLSRSRSIPRSGSLTPRSSVRALCSEKGCRKTTLSLHSAGIFFVLNTEKKLDLQLRTAEKAVKTLRVRNRSAASRLKRERDKRIREGRQVARRSTVDVHYVEPQSLPSETFCPRKKIYAQIRASSSHGIPVTELGTLYVAKLLKSIYDVTICIHLLCRNARCPREIKIAKRWFHVLLRYVSQREDIFGTSKFVRQSLKVLSITLRLTESHLRWKDAHSVGTRESGEPVSLG
jgi:hypothetical protein